MEEGSRGEVYIFGYTKDNDQLLSTQEIPVPVSEQPCVIGRRHSKLWFKYHTKQKIPCEGFVFFSSEDHFELSCKDGKFYIKDVSRHGTFVSAK